MTFMLYAGTFNVFKKKKTSTPLFTSPRYHHALTNLKSMKQSELILHNLLPLSFIIFQSLLFLPLEPIAVMPFLHISYMVENSKYHMQRTYYDLAY